MIRVIVTGGKDFDNYDALSKKLDHLLKNKIRVEIVTSDNEGADALAIKYANEHSYGLKIFRPKFFKDKRAAKYKVNGRMANYGDVSVVFWDGKCKNTQHFIKASKSKKIDTRIVRYTTKNLENS